MKSLLKVLLFSFLLIGSSLSLADNVKEGNRLYAAGKYKEAMTCFMKPDAVTNPATMNRIGYMYKKGRGVEKNLAEAVKWYRKAAEAGFAAAQFNLGLTYEEGYGV
ncbi:tetratricopeptide repeat protein, partial [Oxalobacter paraformigenes]